MSPVISACSVLHFHPQVQEDDYRMSTSNFYAEA